MQGLKPVPTVALASPVKAATIELLPEPVLPRSQTTGAIAAARRRMESSALGSHCVVAFSSTSFQKDEESLFRNLLHKSSINLQPLEPKFTRRRGERSLDFLYVLSKWTRYKVVIRRR